MSAACLTADATVRESETASALVSSLMLVGRRWRARLNLRLRALGQTDARLAAMATIAEAADGLPQHRLAEELGVEAPTVVRLVDALETQGLVERRTGLADRRQKLVHLNPQAESLLTQASAIERGLQRSLFDDIDPGDLAACRRVLDMLASRLAAH